MLGERGKSNRVPSGTARLIDILNPPQTRITHHVVTPFSAGLFTSNILTIFAFVVELDFL
ncbi:MAG: hypothetical protein JWO20_3230 [Candidatus Angelobacter sp.]|nr:hypothetical protein [Candidatus Angelobacter sp.]